MVLAVLEFSEVAVDTNSEKIKVRGLFTQQSQKIYDTHP